jgi:uncharacterized protein (TIGR03663 family)
MHHDEANQAVKFGALLEKGEYRYDRDDHHGPSLYYLTLPLAKAAGRHTLASLDETVLRLVPALFGAATLLILLLFLKSAGAGAVLASGIFLAASPAAVYYSRFYIQETILLFFIAAFLASVWRYILNPSWGWAAAAGLCAGMMYATKETSVIAFGAVAGGLIITLMSGRKGEEARGEHGGFRAWHFLLALASALAVAGLLFSSFFSHPQGVLDSILSFRVYIARGSEAGWHRYPWYHYLSLLAFSRLGASAPWWSEGVILFLALIGGIAAFGPGRHGEPGRSFSRFVLFYTIFSTAVYSLLPYKTPWNLLPFHFGIILLAGTGTARVLRALRPNAFRAAALMVIAAGVIHLGVQAYRANFKDFADPRNPYVYAQTGLDFMRLIKRVDDLAAVHPDHKEMLIEVVAGSYETWPLPWYLRSFAKVGYWQDADQAGTPSAAAVVISSMDQEERLQVRLGEGFHSEYYGLRPEVVLALHVRNDLWERYITEKAGK